jgi:hypothetical protein
MNEKRKTYIKEWEWRNKERRSEYKSEWGKQRYAKNKEAIKLQSKIYYNEHKQEIKERLKTYCREYYKKNYEKLKKTNSEIRKKDGYGKRAYYGWVKPYRLKRYGEKPLIKLTDMLRKRTYEIFKSKGIKKNIKTEKLLGAQFSTVKEHIESQFLEGMNWDNYNYKTWHIDHIKPLSLAKTEEELIALCHYTNLQPLWAIDNLTKSNKYITVTTNE